MSELLKLAERCEAAAGQDRALDATIAVALSGDAGAWVVTPHPDSIFSHQPGWYRTTDDLSVSAPPFTGSIDAAMTLVPKGWVRDIVDADNGDCICRLDDDDDTESSARAKTWPLAIVSAALRVRDALTNSEGGGE